MNVKNKVIAFVMSFFICFGFVSNSFANDKEYVNSNMYSRSFVGLTPQMIGVLGTLGVASGVVFSSNDQIVNFAYDFYQRNKENWDTIDNIFKTCVTIGANQVVKVGKEFLNYFNEFIEGFSKTDINNNIKFGSYVELGTVGDLGLEIGESFKINTGIIGYYSDYSNLMGNVYFYVERYAANSYHIGYSVGSSTRNYVFKGKSGTLNDSDVVQYIVQEKGTFKPYINVGSIYGSVSSSIIVVGKSAGAGSVSMDKVNDNLNDDDSVGIYVPGNVGSLVGSPSGSTVYDGVNSPSYDLPIGGSVSIPTVNDKYQVGLDTPFIEGVDVPGDIPGDIPGDTPGIIFPPFGSGLDFTPITQSSFTDKFPFSLAKDIKNIISVFDVEPKAPKFTVPIVSEELEIDLTQFNVWAGIIRFFVLIGFITSLINITRKVIG